MIGVFTAQSEANLVGHFSAERVLGADNVKRIVEVVLFCLVAELDYGDENGKSQSTEQYDKHPANVSHAERVCLRVLVLLIPATGLLGVLPPLVVEHLDLAFLLQLEDR
jgi:hypothetical protein